MKNNYAKQTCFWLFCLLASSFIEVSAQQRNITGTVVDADSGDPLPGVNVVVEGTSTGTITDVNGSYSMNSPDDATLSFSYIGYQTVTSQVGSRSVIDIQLVSDISQLEEIVVVGYGTQAKKDVTGSIASVGSSKIEQRPVTSITEAIQGLVPGINIAQRNASPGELSAVTIRAAGSISAGSDPLWVIDGFPTDQRNAVAISPLDIESVEILKDASATAIYGSRGANGVIIITTKSGQEGASRISVSVTTGVSQVPESERMTLLNSEEYVRYYTEQNGGTAPDWIANNWDGQTDTDWQDAVMRTGAFQNYAISASGGSNKISYLLSTNYIDQEGTIIGEGQKKYSARLKADYRPNSKLTFGVNLAPNITRIQRSSPNLTTDFSSIQAQAYLLPPILPIRRADGTYSNASDLSVGGGTGLLNIANPLETAENYQIRSNLFRFLGGANVSYEILEGLTLKSVISANFATNDDETFYVSPGPRFQLPGSSELRTGQSQSMGWLNENTISYKRSAGDHSFDVLAGLSFQNNRFESTGAFVRGLQVAGPRVVSIGDSGSLQGFNSNSENAIVSYLGRANYSFRGKYLLTATVRRDGSSRFGVNELFHTFGSVAVGWRLSEEEFIQNLGFVDNAKIRASIGTTGSNEITDFPSRANYIPVRQSFGGSQTFGINTQNPGNDNLTWETSDQLDIGFDLSIFNNKFSMTFDYFNNKTSGLILSRNLVPSTGFGGFLTNIGSMRNKGIELSLNAKVVDQDDFEVNIGGNITTNDQEILDLGGEDEIFNFFGALRRVVGGELQQIRGPKSIGVARVGESYPAQPNIKPGQLVYDDFDGNGSIGNFLSTDAQLLGDTNIDLIYGLNGAVRYKNFTLSTLLQGQSGAHVYDFWQIQIQTPFRYLNLAKEFWYDGRYVSESEPGNGKTPGAVGGLNDGIYVVSSFGDQKTDYVRIRNVTLNYDIPATFATKYGIENARVYLAVENLHTFSDFVGGNPETRRLSGGGPALIGGSQIAGVGDNRELGLTSPGSLPLPRIWTLGINLSF
ncbi:MAG: TonB-dependent receptor [Bacteroidetes bacterium]|nr:TonB-dependent receptor [Bacteroidota bacterium]MDA1119299.1 TonB-dependent receptor [Bacteroidota bacterium]